MTQSILSQIGGKAKTITVVFDEGLEFDFVANDHNYKFQSTHPCRVRQCHLTLFCKNKVSTDIEYTINSLYFHCFS